MNIFRHRQIELRFMASAFATFGELSRKIDDWKICLNSQIHIRNRSVLCFFRACECAVHLIRSHSVWPIYYLFYSSGVRTHIRETAQKRPRNGHKMRAKFAQITQITYVHAPALYK